MRSNKSERRYIITIVFISIGFIFSLRLLFLQVFDDSLKHSAESNVLRHITDYPGRGLVYDRYGELLAFNDAVYDLMVVPRHVQIADTSEFCSLLSISEEDFIKKITKAKKYSRYKASLFEKQLSKKAFGIFQEKMYKYPGFFVQTRTLRKYPHTAAAHTLGYIGEVGSSKIEKDKYYKKGDYIGISGLERSYEEELRGEKGVNIVMVDVFNRAKGSYKEGEFDKTAIPGKDLHTSMDLDLQKYGELLMQNKRGSIVAIEPSTGEILAIITAPHYDPNLLVGRIRSKNYRALAKDSCKPLFNRAIMAQYPPGSTFKLVNALIGLHEGVITPKTTYSCEGGFRMGRIHVGCHEHKSLLKLDESVQHSCNAYYCKTFMAILDKSSYKNTEEAYQSWRKHVISFGFGKKFGNDLSYELSGSIPKTTYYDKWYGRNHWKPLTIISLAIGQGEILATPVQLANLAAVIANRGYYYTPHIVCAVGDTSNTIDKYNEKKHSSISPNYYESIVEGMHMVVEEGTGVVAQIDSIAVCGKTGTAQNPHGKDHSIFIAFAPKDNPKIAISVFVENAGYGSTWAAPIASLMAEKYLNRIVKRKRLEERIMKPVN